MANRLEKHLDRMKALETEQQVWKTVWKDIRDYIMPMRGMFEETDQPNRGDLRMDKIVDATPIYAARILANGLRSGLCSPARRWFKPELDDQDLLEWGPAKEFVGKVEEIMYSALDKSNFYQAQAGKYAELGPFGTACTISEEHPQKYFRFVPLTIGSYFICEGPDGAVDTLYRRLWIRAKVAYQRWGDRLSENAKKLVNQNTGSGRWQMIKVIHVIEPRKLRDPERMDKLNMPWASIYFEEDEASKGNILEESGFQENPIHCARWATTGADVWGRGPGYEVLPDCKMLQEMKKVLLMQLHKQANPPMAVPGGYGENLNLLPGGQNPYVGDKPGLIHPLFQSQPDLRGFALQIEAVQQQIRIGMYNDLFMMLDQLDNGKNVTAEFIRGRMHEKLLLLGPVVERLVDDLQTTLERVYAILARRGAFPPPPQELEGKELRWRFLSTLAQAQKLAATQSIDAVANYVKVISEIIPAAADKLDADQSIDEYGEAVLAPVGVIRPDDEVAEIRKQRAQAEAEARRQEQAALAAQQAEQMARTGQTLAETVPKEGSALEELKGMLEGLGG